MTAPELLAGGVYGTVSAFLWVALFFSWFALLSRASVVLGMLMLLITPPMALVLLLLAAVTGTAVTQFIPGLQGQLDTATLFFGPSIILEPNIGIFVGLLLGVLLLWNGVMKPLGLIGPPVKGDPDTLSTDPDEAVRELEALAEQARTR